MWDSLTAELTLIPQMEISAEIPPQILAEAGGPAGREALAVQVQRLERFAMARRTQDLPVQAVLAGWKGECAAWRAQAQRNARYGATGLPLPLLGWFTNQSSWWPEGLAVDPATIDLASQDAVASWMHSALENVEALTLSPLPELDELADPAVRLGLAVIRDAVMGSASRCVDFLREAVLQGFLAAASESLGMWFENRGAAPMAIVDEMRTHIEYAAARRQFVGLIAPAVEEATASWSHSTRQPLNTLARLTFRMESIVRADDVNTNLALEED